MTFSPFLEISPVIQLHASAAMLALVIGPFAIYRKRRDMLHKCLGYLWVVSMLIVAISAIFIPSFGLAVIGPFGPIHLFIALTFHSLWIAMTSIWQGDVVRHQAAMRGLYRNALIIAGGLTLLPGRMVNEMLFVDRPTVGLYCILIGGIVLIWSKIRRIRAQRWRWLGATDRMSDAK